MTVAPIPSFALFGETAPFPDVLHIESFSARAPVHGWQISPHRHSAMAQLFVIEDGRVEAQIDARKVRLETGDFLFVPAQSVHAFDFQPDTEGHVLSFPLSLIGGADVQAALKAAFSGRVDAMLGTLVSAMVTAGQSQSLFRAAKLTGLAQSMLAHIAEHQGGTGSEDPRLTRFAQLIAEQAARWTASDYANALNISTGHLSRITRGASGLGATGYIEAQVMEEACRLLAFTQFPVSEVGYRLGFADPSYFSKRFRRAKGQSPSDYRLTFTG